MNGGDPRRTAETSTDRTRQRLPLGARIALAAMARLEHLDLARGGSRLAFLVPVVVGFLGWWLALSLSSGPPSRSTVTLLIEPVAIGAVWAAIGSGKRLGWLLLGFALTPALAVVSARLSEPVPENSGFAIVEYSMLGLVLVTLGFFGWLGVRRVWAPRQRGGT